MAPEKIINVERDQGLRIGLEAAESILKAGGVVAFPTESFYGLAADVHNEDSLRRLFSVKRREADQPLLLILSSMRHVRSYVSEIPQNAVRLMERFWPGGLTLVFRASRVVSPILTAGSGKIGLRVSSHPVARALARRMGGAVTGTSANISGQPNCLSAREVFDTMGEDLGLVLDGGETAGGKGSTILDITTAPPVLLRDGMISRAMLGDNGIEKTGR